MRIEILTAVASALAATVVTAQFPPAPGPDILLPDGSLDGVYRLVDRDGNGVYDYHTGEVYDYALSSNLDSSWRKVAAANGWYYTAGPKLDKVWKFRDANSDGIVTFATEASIAFDPVVQIGSVATALDLLDVVSDGIALYVTNYSGLNEGIWKLRDLNADGNFEFALGEVKGAFVEVGSPGGGVASVAIANSTIPGAVCIPGELQSMSWDPTTSPGSLALGRVLVENEDNSAECTMAFEDKNGDHDFVDAGECYIFLNLCTDQSRGLYADRTPAASSFPALYQTSYYEIEHVEVDTSGPQTVWYVISEDSSGVPSGNMVEWGIVFRCVDVNLDSDCNDAGECSVWFDCSGDSVLGATNQYRLITGSGIWAGVLYLTAEHLGGTGVDFDHILALKDLDASGVIDQPNEVAVVHAQNNQTMYNPMCILPGLLPAPPAGTPGYYDYVTPANCLATTTAPGGTTHNIAAGSNNWNDKFAVGETVPVRTFGAKASTALALHIGFQVASFPLNASGTCTFDVNPFIAATGIMTDAAGTFTLPITVTTGLVGLPLWWQYVALDLGASDYNVTTSDTMFTVFGNYAFTQNGL